jgi:hypothetical protein
MELSANWKKLKATLEAEAPRKLLPKNSYHQTKTLKRKQQPPAPATRPEKKAKIDHRRIMDGDFATERVNEGLSEGYLRPFVKWCLDLTRLQCRNRQICCNRL